MDILKFEARDGRGVLGMFNGNRSVMMVETPGFKKQLLVIGIQCRMDSFEEMYYTNLLHNIFNTFEIIDLGRSHKRRQFLVKYPSNINRNFVVNLIAMFLD